MLHELQTSREFLFDTTGTGAGASASNSSSAATVAGRRRETDVIMEALLREYLNCSPPKAEP